ncbi:MAG: cytochrome c [Hyphomonadaceae bacterium]|nr:cytochrome c [Hyphomonadaceae bacterium]
MHVDLRLIQFASIVALALAACTSAPPAPRARQSATTEVGNPALGLSYAQANCAVCHAVIAGLSESPNPMAPTFEEIARTPGMTRIALTVWLQTPHPNMPNLIVDPNHVDDLSAYLTGLDSDD